MKTFLLKNPKRILALASLAGICGLIGTASAQNTGRIYADLQKAGHVVGVGTGTVTNAGNAITTTDLQDYSTLSVTGISLGITPNPEVTQYLEFTTDGTNPKSLPVGTIIHIKFKASAGLLGLNAASLLGKTEIGTFTNLSGNSPAATATESAFTSTSDNLVSLVSGVGNDELAFATTKVSNGVYLKLTSDLAALGYSTDLFHAYIYGDLGSSTGCPKTADYVFGTGRGTNGSGTLLDIAGALSSVDNPLNAIDQDPTTAATIHANEVANRTYFAATLNKPAKAGDSVRIILSNPSGGLINVAALSGMSIQAYSGPTQVANVANTSSLLTLSLLPGATDVYQIAAAVPAAFDRIELSVGGVASVTSLLGNGDINIYGIDVVVPAPQTGNSTNAKQYAYAGSSIASLNAATNTSSDPIVWYTSGNGTGEVSFPLTGLTTGTHVYYGRSSRDGCTSASGNDTLNLIVASIKSTPLPNGTVGSIYTGNLSAAVDQDPGLPNTPAYIYTITSHNFAPSSSGSTSISFQNQGNFYAFAPLNPIYASGPAYSNLSSLFASTDLTNGLSVDDQTGDITGNPQTEGVYTIEADVIDHNNGDISAGHITQTITIAAALPVDLSNFDVNLDANKNAVLSWTTESEQGSIRFDVLRSNDGTNFTTIGSVDAAGVSTQAKNYSFTDHNPGAKSYYKLNVVKVDGIKSSKTVSITGGRVAGFSINPNPASNNITITGISNIKSVSIYDASGRLVQTATNSYISVRNLSAGIYFVTVVSTDGNKTNGKFIKK